ncbi:MAG: uracil-DNA glycosylase [Pseudobdellovibrio sp.]|jgi:uracil-DNA glycosylase|nr:uracil-DNA glycosylase [Pseudobdellovibrio sp.]
MDEIRLSNSWRKHLAKEFGESYMKHLITFLAGEYKKNKIIFPSVENYFAALDLVDVEKVKVVILGQDPYHGENEAHGLCFSVQDGIAIPPSLRNIFKELKNDVGCDAPKSGDLTTWSKQGVLLLNSVLTVEKDKAASHQGKGWEQFTDKIISVVNDHTEKTVFILWGAYAQKKAAFVDRNRHLVIESPHPSPLAAHRGFFGSKPFSKTNEWLRANGKEVIRWC